VRESLLPLRNPLRALGALASVTSVVIPAFPFASLATLAAFCAKLFSALTEAFDALSSYISEICRGFRIADGFAAYRPF